ncbi:UPF0182 family membrane protein [Halanaeroarchaeum sulfurireducens]|uniref:UPF0182 family membrane protein n=1 Tax=Halanaeroarchaeum sulfurireducens TaxID=1604004 RepID=UPI0006C91AFB|nr:UPF0182 family protein [Halanaeroarchaeum sulfurireducens]
MQRDRGIWWRLGRWGIVALAVIAVFVVFSLYGDFLWFSALDYENVFLTIIGYRLGLFTLTAVLSLPAFYQSYRVTSANLDQAGVGSLPGLYPIVLVAMAFLIGLTYASSWDTVLRFLHATSFGVSDPVLGREVAFYVYLLPFVNLILGFAFLVSGVALVFALLAYAFPFIVTMEQRVESPETDVSFDIQGYLSFLRDHAYSHLVTIFGVLLILQGGSFFLNRYELLYSTRGAVFGMGATDQRVFLPLFGLLAVTSVLGGLVVLANAWVRDFRAVYVPVAIIVGFLLIGQGAGFVYQDFVVEPDEFNKEAQFIENEIEFTNAAYALDRVDEREFPVSETLTREQVDANPGTIENVRLWDPKPLLTTYNELQIFRTYYQFTDVDVDRYDIDGRERQVMISARELEFGALPQESRSWVNRHLVYTHGYGVAMSPVSETTADGLPEFYIQDIPPNSTDGVEVTQPRIYYGETTTDYAIVNTGTRELDYPSGEQNVYTNYDGDGGVVLDSSLKKLVYAFKFSDPQIFFSDSVTAESRLQFNRDIQTRAPQIAPFLDYDRDPYVVVSEGELFWIYDAYTTTDAYPYSDRVQFKGERANYVRNSGKVVVDADTGETTYYVAEPDDPLIQTYRKAFPGLSEDFERMPEDLQQHVRYPEDAFRVQANQYLEYHMKDPQVFYNKEDEWRTPNEVSRGQEIAMDPYYVIMTFPGEDNPEFVMIQPYIPAGRQNMIGWLGARSDPPKYGRLDAYLFSKQQLIYGPMQIESRIDQDADISQQITLWSESGSSVIRGNLLAIPIDDTVMYVEPLFLESREQGALPELKRVILTHGDDVVMEPSLEEAIAVQVGAARAEPSVGGAGLTEAELERARTLYGEAQAALQDGDFATYAERISELGELLEGAEDRESGTTEDRETGNTTSARAVG